MVLSLTTGCSTPQAPVSADRIWEPPEDQFERTSDDGVWEGLRSRKLDGPVALAELVDRAIQANPSLRQQWALAKQSEYTMRQTESAYYPSLTVKGNVQSGKTDNNALNEGTTVTSYGPQAQLQWLLLDLGGRSASVKAAAEQLLSSNYTFNQTFQDVLRDVETAYYSLYSAQAAVTAAQANVEASLKTLDAAKQREKAGLGIHLDVLQAQTDYDKAQYDLEDALATVKTSQGQLAQVVGLPADAAIEIIAPQRDLPGAEDISQDDIGKIIDDALGRRPDIAALRATVNASQFSVESASSDLWPQLVAGGTADKTWNRYSLDQLENNDTYTYLGYVALSWDIFDGFLNLNKERASQAALEAAREQLQSAELAASADVWSKYFTLQSTLKKLNFARTALATSEEAYSQALDSYNAGLKDITFLLNSQSQLSAARSTMVATENELYIAYVNLAHATGVLNVNNTRMNSSVGSLSEDK
jgi:outer membrane protein TolC